MTPSQTIILKRTDSNDPDFLAPVAMLDKDLLDQIWRFAIHVRAVIITYWNLDTVLVAYQNDACL